MLNGSKFKKEPKVFLISKEFYDLSELYKQTLKVPAIQYFYIA
jgi:hypothetical protein